MAVKSKFVPLSKAVEILGVSPSTLYRYEKVGLIRAHRTAGGHRRFSVDELSLFLEKMRNSFKYSQLEMPKEDE